MIAIHDQFTRQMRSRLKSTGIGLGLVRLLQDARRFEEARTALSSLENGFQNDAEGSDKPSRLKGVSRSLSLMAQNADDELVLSSR